jgi:hypothetical protein
MRPIDWLRGVRADMAETMAMALSQGMKCDRNGDDITDEITGSKVAYLALLDEMIATSKYDPRYA